MDHRTTQQHGKLWAQAIHWKEHLYSCPKPTKTRCPEPFIQFTFEYSHYWWTYIWRNWNGHAHWSPDYQKKIQEMWTCALEPWLTKENSRNVDVRIGALTTQGKFKKYGHAHWSPDYPGKILRNVDMRTGALTKARTVEMGNGALITMDMSNEVLSTQRQGNISW